MADLIDRQAAIDAVNKICDRCGEHKKYNGVMCGTCNLDGVADIIEDLPSAPPDQRWIPVSERLPNCNGCYLVWRPHFFGGEIGMPSICYFDGKDTWHDSYGVDFSRILQPSDVTAWMPLPEPYKGGE